MKEIFNVELKRLSNEQSAFMHENKDRIRNIAGAIIEKADFPLNEPQKMINCIRIKGEHYRFDWTFNRKDEKNVDWKLLQIQHLDVDEYLDLMNEVEKVYKSGKGTRIKF